MLRYESATDIIPCAGTAITEQRLMDRAFVEMEAADSGRRGSLRMHLISAGAGAGCCCGGVMGGQI
jgi:hypothetical protein